MVKHFAFYHVIYLSSSFPTLPRNRSDPKKLFDFSYVLLLQTAIIISKRTIKNICAILVLCFCIMSFIWIRCIPPQIPVNSRSHATKSLRFDESLQNHQALFDALSNWTATIQLMLRKWFQHHCCAFKVRLKK